MRKCIGITQGSERCKRIAIDSSDYCYAHHPDHADDRARAARKGGRRGGRGRPQAELSEIKRHLLELVDDVLGGDVDRSDAAVAGQLLNTVVRAIGMEMKVREVEDLAREVEEIREALEQRGGDRRWGV